MRADDEPLLQGAWTRALLDRVRNSLTPKIAARRNRFWVRALAATADLYLDMVANVCYELEVNGERRLLTTLGDLRPGCVFDVGANVGDWSMLAARVFPQARIHAFEIVPDTAAEMTSRLAGEGVSTVSVNSCGLSAHSGTVQVAYIPGFSAGSSAVAAHPTGGGQWRECQVSRGDAYCRDHDIDHIDLLELDVEGLESKVLEGFDRMLSDGDIDVVQFEYGHVNAAAGFLLGDFYRLFERYGYAVGKVYPDRVDFRAYDAWRDENFRGPVYVAVRRVRGDLIQRLSRPETTILASRRRPAADVVPGRSTTRTAPP